MRRAGVTIAVLLGLAAWAGAQGPAPGLATTDRVRLLKANRAVLAELVGSGVELAGADDPLARAAAAGRTVRALGVAFRAAAEAGDADRAADLGNHLSATARDGLVPALDRARDMIPVNSPQAKELAKLRAKAADELGGYKATGAAADTPAARRVGDELDGLREKLK